MKFNNVCIEAFGYALPTNVWTSDDIEELTCGSCEKEFFVSVRKSFSFEVKTDLDDF